ncbi:MAG: metallophosphoesterase family protein [Polyangiaceae bacterium]|nr:metallophosphoesterase family protein [Polyangiaceae bacterium]
MRKLATIAVALVPLATACTPNNAGNLEGEEGDLTHELASRDDSNSKLTDSCGEVEISEAGKAISRLPYLQQTTPTSTHLMWAGPGMRDAKVVVTTPDGELYETAEAKFEGRGDTEKNDRLIAGLGDLEPDTTYCYEIQDAGGEPLIGRIGFKTAPKEDAAARFIVLGDSGDGTADQEALAEQLSTVPFDLMLHVGDIAYPAGGFAEFQANFFDYYDNILMHHPFFPVPGNHEYRTKDAIPYRALFDLPNNERWYSFDWGVVHFVGLDTEQMGETQTRWLAADLAKNEKKWTVAFLHKPAFSSGFHGSDGGVREDFVPLFEKYGVDIVLQGHDHHYERTKPQNGITYFVTGGGGAGTYPVEPSDFTAVAQEVVEFLYVTADDNELAVHTIDATGKEFDQLVLKK